MKQTFVVLYTPGSAWLEGKPILEQPLKAHLDYMHHLQVSISILHRSLPIIGSSLIAASPTAPSRTSPFLHHLLKLSPLFGREHLLKTLVRLSPNLVNARLGFSAQCVQPPACLVEDLLHLSPLLRIQLQAVEHLLEPDVSRHAGRIEPSVIGEGRERARRRAEQKNDDRREPKLPFIFSDTALKINTLVRSRFYSLWTHNSCDVLIRDQATPAKIEGIKAGRAQAKWKSLLFVLTTTEAVVATVCGASGVLRFRLLYRL